MALLVAAAHADTLGFVPQVEAVGPSQFTGTRGYRFGPRPDREVYITHLGIYDGGGDGLVNPHEVGLWWDDLGSLAGTLLTSVTIPAGTEAPLHGGFRWVEITPIQIINSFQAYTIAAHYAVSDADDLLKPYLPQFAPDVGVVVESGLYSLGTSLAYPTSLTYGGEGQLGERFFQANFQYVVVPEPAAWMLWLTTTMCFCVWRRAKP